MQKVIRIGSWLVAIVILILTLACGASAVAVHQRVVSPPRVNMQLAGYRLAAYPLTIRAKPPQYYYSIWLFVTSYQPGSTIRTETGEQIMLLRLRSD
jgi:hypothetical protein